MLILFLIIFDIIISIIMYIYIVIDQFLLKLCDLVLRLLDDEIELLLEVEFTKLSRS